MFLFYIYGFVQNFFIYLLSSPKEYFLNIHPGFCTNFHKLNIVILGELLSLLKSNFSPMIFYRSLTPTPYRIYFQPT